jgi:sialidase-1
MPHEPTLLTIAPASPENPRNSEAAIVERRDGSLLLVWQEYLASERGSEDDAPNRLAAMVSHDGGRTWTDRRVLVETAPGDVNVYSPSLVRLPDGDLLFTYFRYNHLVPGEPPLGSAYACRSRDEGETFSAPEVIFSRESIAFPSSTAKLLSTGRILLPVERQVGNVWSPTDHEVVGAAWSDDGGHTWRHSEHWADVPLRGAMEAHVEELKDGRILMVMRTQLGSVFQAHSADGGETWSLPQTTGLRAPESCPDLARLPRTGDLMIVWNNAPYDPGFASHYGKRSPLTVAISSDESLTWTHVKNVEDDPGWAYSNPGCTFTRGGQCLLNYWAVAYTPDWLMSGPIDLKLAILDLDWLYS